jgi:hypothetical protein
MLDPDRARDTGIRKMLKEKVDNPDLAKHLTLHLIASIYLEGLHLRGEKGKPAIWTIYPAIPVPQTGVLEWFAQVATQLFKRRYEPELILRHSTAVKSAFARLNDGIYLLTINCKQFISIPLVNKKSKGETYLLLMTSPHTHIALRLPATSFQCWAAGVICIAVGKYPVSYSAYCPEIGVAGTASLQQI